MRYQLFIIVLLSLFSLGFFSLGSFATAEVQDAGVMADESKNSERPKKPKKKKKDDVALAVIVHPKNSIKKVSYSELRAYLKARRQFWPNKKRCDLFLPPTTSPAYQLLLKTVYKTTHKKLQKYWTRKQFSGDIATKPSYVSSFQAAGKLVLAKQGGLSIVPANRVPKGARVLLIDGKKPGDEGYKLSGKKQTKK